MHPGTNQKDPRRNIAPNVYPEKKSSPEKKKNIACQVIQSDLFIP